MVEVGEREGWGQGVHSTGPAGVTALGLRAEPRHRGKRERGASKGEQKRER